MAALAGRDLVQLSTGTPREARETAMRVAALGGGYVDAAIKCYPDGVGRADSLVFAAGAPSAWNACAPHLRLIGGDLRYLGENVAAAAALDLGMLAVSVGLYLGVAQGARICQSEVVGVDRLAGAIGFGALPRNRLEIVHAGAYALNSLHPGASLEVWADVVDRLRVQARDAGISAELPDLAGAIHARAIAAGLGPQDIAALVKVLQDPATAPPAR